jgi:hypothetical protein
MTTTGQGRDLNMEMLVALTLIKLLNSKYLEKARNIADVQNPGSDDGTFARILWKQAEILKQIHAAPEQIESFEARATKIRRDITGESPASAEWVTDEDFEKLEHAYDLLVPGFFR